jgi:hypothetical protein
MTTIKHKADQSELKVGDSIQDPDEGEFIISEIKADGVVASSASGHIKDHFFAAEWEEEVDDE